MRMFRRIPRNLLTKTMTVSTPNADGTYGEPVPIIGVLFQRKDEVTDDAHRSTVSRGVVYVDAVNSKGAFEVPTGSRVVVGGCSYLVRKCEPGGDLLGRVECWRLELG